jgi:hypothetical protein
VGGRDHDEHGFGIGRADPGDVGEQLAAIGTPLWVTSGFQLGVACPRCLKEFCGEPPGNLRRNSRFSAWLPLVGRKFSLSEAPPLLVDRTKLLQGRYARRIFARGRSDVQLSSTTFALLASSSGRANILLPHLRPSDESLS